MRQKRSNRRPQAPPRRHDAKKSFEILKALFVLSVFCSSLIIHEESFEGSFIFCLAIDCNPALLPVLADHVRVVATTRREMTMLVFQGGRAVTFRSAPAADGRKKLLFLSLLAAFVLLTTSAWAPPVVSVAANHRRQLGISIVRVVQSRSRTCLFGGEEDCNEETACTGTTEISTPRASLSPILWHREFFSLCLSTALFLGSSLEASAASDLSSSPPGQRYWSAMAASTPAQERVVANENLLDYAVGTVNTQFYDNTGGAFFAPREFYSQWKLLKRVASGEEAAPPMKSKGGSSIPVDIRLDTREGAVQGLKWLVGSLNDPFSKYLTREELQQELQAESSGLLGTGAVVEPPHVHGDHQFSSFFGPQQQPLTTSSSSSSFVNSPKTRDQHHHQKKILTITRAANLPVVTAVAPDSPAERAGLVVGDRIVGVGDQDFLGWTRAQVEKQLASKYNQRDYFGQADITVAKPIYAISSSSDESSEDDLPNMLVGTGGGGGDPSSPLSFPRSSSYGSSVREVVLGYRQARVRLPIAGAAEPFVRSAASTAATGSTPEAIIVGGDSIVHYQLLTSRSGSIFDHPHSGDALSSDDYKVGYIRLTRFSKASTTRYVQAVQALEEAGAQSYILDLRNNYGGVIQEAMLTASTLLRDPHAVLCYTMNARGGFTPHDAEEYIVDQRYPGYLLSSESKQATMDQVQKENPAMFTANGIAWDPPSAYASLHEQVTKRGIRRIGYRDGLAALLEKDPVLRAQFQAQKKIVVLENEGTASAAEVFVAALHDNARTVAVVGTKSYGKGLIQHTFPMPDGGGLRLTVAEYLTPALSHVTTVGGARFDPRTGELVGGGIYPDIVCESKQGIPGNIRADLCVGVALDALEEANDASQEESPRRSPSWGLMASIPSQLLGHRDKTK